MRFQVVVMTLVHLTGPIAVTDRDTLLPDMKIRLICGPGMQGFPTPLGPDKVRFSSKPGRPITK